MPTSALDGKDAAAIQATTAGVAVCDRSDQKLSTEDEILSVLKFRYNQ